jgi:thioredoxin 1
MEDITKGKVLLDFYATWCNPCKIVSRQLDLYEAEISDVKVVRLDIEDPANFKVAQDYAIRSLPTLIYLEEGDLINKALGTKNLQQIKELTNK